MKALQLQGFQGLDDLKFIETETPKPGHGEVLVKMKAASLNYRDLITVSGGYGKSVKTPLVPLSDGCAEIVEVGEGVHSVAPGDRVAPFSFRNGWLDRQPH